MGALAAQKQQDIPNTEVVTSFTKRLPGLLDSLHLADLSHSTQPLSVRVWNGRHEVFTVSRDSAVSTDYKMYLAKERLHYISYDIPASQSRALVDALLSPATRSLSNGNHVGIGGQWMFIEIATPDVYKIVSHWSPGGSETADRRHIARLLSLLRDAADSEARRAELLDGLPAGDYMWGRTSVRIDRFIQNDVATTEFYKQAEAKIKQELGITDATHHFDYPLIMINGQPRKIADLNRYRMTQVAKFKVVGPKDLRGTIWGGSGANGIVMVVTR